MGEIGIPVGSKKCIYVYIGLMTTGKTKDKVMIPTDRRYIKESLERVDTDTRESLMQKDREEWRRLCHEMSHPGGTYISRL
jgi:hypothetical protein